MKMLSAYRLLTVAIFAMIVVTTQAQKTAWVKQLDNEFLLNTEYLNHNLAQLAKGASSIEMFFPGIEGELEIFEIYDNRVLPIGLANKYPQVHSFKGIQKNDPNTILRFTCTTYGIEATILSGDRILNLTRALGNKYTLKVDENQQHIRQSFTCNTLAGMHNRARNKSLGNLSARQLSSDNVFRTVRLALATTGETSAYFINKSGLQSASDAEKKAAVLAGVSTSINNMNVAFERDLGVRFNLIENNDDLFFLNSQTDPFDDDGDLFLLIDQGRAAIENRIPFSDYDMGHLITSSGNGGLASVSGICSDFKADAVTGFGMPEGFFFDFTLFAHELGHQLGGEHTQSARCQEETPIEVGSGTTIMGYSGACGINDIQPASDPFFHSQSIEQIFDTLDFLGLDGNCGVAITEINNSLPVIPELNNYVVPVGLPLYLDVEVIDADNDDLTYSWEQYDQEFGAASPPRANSVFGPQFRVFPPITESRRDFPTSGVNSRWEVLPTVERTMNFRLTVRDGNPSGIVISNIIQLQLINNPELFRITSPSQATTFNQNENNVITWDVANTNRSPYNVSEVKIEYSFDGGVSYPVVLAERIPNSGSATVRMPVIANANSELSNGKIRISALENAFYTVTTQPITLNAFPETSVTIAQDFRENVLIFKIRSSFPAPKDIFITPSFIEAIGNQSIDFSNELLVSSDFGETYFPYNGDNLFIKQEESEIWLAVPLTNSESQQNNLEGLVLSLSIPDGSSNTELSQVININNYTIEQNVVFNNPASGLVTFSVKQRQLEDYTIQIYSINGALVKSIQFGEIEQQYSVDALQSGLYIVRISLAGASTAKKLIIL